MNKAYLGDSVYVRVDEERDCIVLTTENGYLDDPRNRIVMEYEVIKNFLTYLREKTNFRVIIIAELTTDEERTHE